MGSFNANILPATDGLNLGTPLQRWNAYLKNLVLPDMVSSLGSVQGSPTISLPSALSLVTMTLAGNCSPAISGTPAIVLFAISQDGTGGHTFTWPAGTVNGMTVGTSANEISYQMFAWDGSTLSAMAPGFTDDAWQFDTSRVYAIAGESVASAISRLPAAGGTVVFSVGTYPSGGVDISRPNVTLQGAGMPSYNSGFTALVGGTIISGPLAAHQGADRLTIRDLGIDNGSALGVPNNALAIYNSGQVVGAAPLQSLVIENVCALGTDPNAAFHCMLVENVTGATIKNVQTVYNGHGLVVKGTAVTINGVYSRGHGTDAIILKSDAYAPCSDVDLTNFHVTYLLTPGDTKGIVVEGIGSLISYINLSNGVVKGAQSWGIYVQGASLTSSASGINISNVTVDYLTTPPVNTYGIQLVQYATHVNISNCNFFNLYSGIVPNLPVGGFFNDFKVNNCDFVNITNRGIHSYGRWAVSNCSFVSVGTALYSEFDNTYEVNTYFSGVTNNHDGAGGFLSAASSTGIFSALLSTTVTALTTPTVLPRSGAASGLLRVRDNTAGGGALFLIDPNGGSQLIGTSQITGLAAAQVTFSAGNWRIALSSGAVPRILTWTIYA